jgi:hypothetical protein
MNLHHNFHPRGSFRPLALASLLAIGGGAVDSAPAHALAVATETVQRTFNLPAGHPVVLQNLNGSVAVTGWDGDQVRVVAVKTARAASESRAYAYLRQVQVQVVDRDGKMMITTRTPGEDGGLRGWITCTGVEGEVAYQLSVPRGASVAAVTVNGNVEVTGMTAPLRAGSTNGNVTLLELHGPVEASSVNGNIHVDLRTAGLRQGMELSTVNGNIVLYTRPELQAYLDARTANGSVGSDLTFQVAGTRSRSRIVGSLNGGTTKLVLRSTNGSIWLRRP